MRSEESMEPMETPEQQAILSEAEAFAREQLSRDASGHDWWHIQRVVTLARRIAREEGADAYICELAALLHDVADYKIAGDEETGLRTVRDWLSAHQVEDAISEQVMEIISTMSFGGGNRPPMRTLEGRVVQDADRLDAIGAIGRARAVRSRRSASQLHQRRGVSPERQLHHQSLSREALAAERSYEHALRAHTGGGASPIHAGILRRVYR